MRFLRSESQLCSAFVGLPRAKTRCHVNRRFLSGTPITQSRKLRRRAAPSRGARCLTEVIPDNFKTEVLKSELPVLVDFWATWCGPCKLLDPTMNYLEEAYKGKLKVVKVETDKNPEIVEKYKVAIFNQESILFGFQVYGLPTIMLFKDGDVIEGSKKEGAITQNQIVQYLDEYGITASTPEA